MAENDQIMMAGRAFLFCVLLVRHVFTREILAGRTLGLSTCVGYVRRLCITVLAQPLFNLSLAGYFYSMIFAF